MTDKIQPIKWAVTPVAGPGLKLLPLTKSQPKEMLSLGSKPVIQYVVDEIVNSGMNQILFVTGPGKSAIENHFIENNDLIDHLRQNGHEDLLQSLEFERNQVKYFFTRQRRPSGVGDAVLCAESIVGENPFVIALGDTILGIHATSDCISRMYSVFAETNADAVIALEQVADNRIDQFGIATVSDVKNDDWIEITRLTEKPLIGSIASNWAIASRYICKHSIFEALHSTARDENGLLQLTDALNWLIDQGKRVVGVPLNQGEKRYDIGCFEDYFQTFIEFVINDPTFGDSARNKLFELIDQSGLKSVK